jgi:hypothetical protein
MSKHPNDSPHDCIKMDNHDLVVSARLEAATARGNDCRGAFPHRRAGMRKAVLPTKLLPGAPLGEATRS